MNKDTFERNLLALSKSDPFLCSRLSSAITSGGVYRFLESRSGETIPALTDSNGAAHPLHSTIDPRREGERLISTLSEEGCLVFLGLGGAFAAEAALERKATRKIFIIEYDNNGIAELLSSRDYVKLFGDERFRFLSDPSPEKIQTFILSNYMPAIDGGIRVFPLRVRTDSDNRFSAAADAVKNAIDEVSRDYSVQAYFGKRWFSNIIRNCVTVEKQNVRLLPVRKAIVCAAGPSLEDQLVQIKNSGAKGQKESFLIATDTSLPVLQNAGLEPDAVISIDCQHISYQHFFGALPQKTLLFLDLASPPLIASRTGNKVFFSGGHPLSLYLSREWRSLPVLDTSGANVTYAALSLAELLGAREISLFGADFSYPRGKTYARGAYIYPYFEKKQFRFAPVEAQHSVFLYRDSSLEKKTGAEGKWYYETRSLRFYREKAREKEKAFKEGTARDLVLFSSGPVRQSAFEFFKEYKKSLELLKSFGPIANHEQCESAELTATMLPLAAYFRRINPLYSNEELFTAVKLFCIKELEKLNN
jgi:hypothetical protein